MVRRGPKSADVASTPRACRTASRAAAESGMRHTRSSRSHRRPRKIRTRAAAGEPKGMRIWISPPASTARTASRELGFRGASSQESGARKAGSGHATSPGASSRDTASRGGGARRRSPLPGRVAMHDGRPRSGAAPWRDEASRGGCGGRGEGGGPPRPVAHVAACGPLWRSWQSPGAYANVAPRTRQRHIGRRQVASTVAPPWPRFRGPALPSALPPRRPVRDVESRSDAFAIIPP